MTKPSQELLRRAMPEETKPVEREAFEAWAIRREFDISPNQTVFADELPYADIETQSHFDAYIAGWAAALKGSR